MSRKCDICGKGTATGMQVSHSQIGLLMSNSVAYQ